MTNTSRLAVSRACKANNRLQQQPRRGDKERVNVIVHVERVEGRSPVATLSNDKDHHRGLSSSQRPEDYRHPSLFTHEHGCVRFEEISPHFRPSEPLVHARSNRSQNFELSARHVASA